MNDGSVNNKVVSWVRTTVPVIVGSALVAGERWVAAHTGVGVDIDDGAASLVVTGAVITAYYSVVHALEQRWPKVGRLLGSARLPYYGDPA